MPAYKYFGAAANHDKYKVRLHKLLNEEPPTPKKQNVKVEVEIDTDYDNIIEDIKFMLKLVDKNGGNVLNKLCDEKKKILANNINKTIQLLQ